jgi:hypothetical protein
MGAYSNPEILVDTQSGQHWRDLQENINATSRQMTNAFIEIGKKNQKLKEGIDINMAKARSFSSKAQKLNPSINVQKACEPLLAEYERIQKDIAFGKSKNIAEDRLKEQNILAAIEKTSGLVQNIASLGEGYSKNISNIGMTGGFSMQNDPTLMHSMAVAGNLSPGKIELDYDFENNYEPRIKFYSGMMNEGENEPFGYTELTGWKTSDQINKMLDENGGLKIIKPMTGIIENLMKSNPSVFDGKGNLLRDYTTSVEQTKKEVNKSTVTNNKADKDVYTVIKKNYLEPDAEKVKAALSMQIDASIAGLAKEGSIQAIYNHYVVGNGDDLADLYTDLSPERTQRVREFIADALIKTIPKTEDDESPERVIEETRKTEAVKPKGANSSKPKEKAEKEKTSKNILSENLNSNYTSPGSLFPSTSGSRYVKVGADGKLYKVDEDEDKVSEKPLTLKEARIYLGLPANGILTVNK